MTLEIAGEESQRKNHIRLERDEDTVGVWIDRAHVATFFDDGKFVYHGTGYNKYLGRWKE